ncbi:MAG: hypothetical protein L3J75_01845 [Methylococcaceae bacterium]|nr:hypothetical protein [Methylococcaceae bacterium]
MKLIESHDNVERDRVDFSNPDNPVHQQNDEMHASSVDGNGKPALIFHLQYLL